MATMGAVPMAGGWLLSGIWLPLCGQSWFETAACFLGMWLAMMVAMMLPSLTPVLWHYRETAFKAGASRPGGLAALAGVGYCTVWTGLGLPVFLVGAALAQIALQFPALSRLVPASRAFVVLMAGLSQFSRWKARRLAGCSASRQQSQTPLDTLAALRAGAALGLRCCLSCAGPMAILIAGRLMDLRLMLCVTLAVTAERLLPPEMRIAPATGAGMSAAGLLLLLRSLE
jgi:predicted metal-binding membrane protein